MPPPSSRPRGGLGWAYPGHSTQHYRDQGISGPGVTDAVLNYITRILIQVSRHGGTLYLILKMARITPGQKEKYSKLGKNTSFQILKMEKLLKIAHTNLRSPQILPIHSIKKELC